MNKIEHAYLAGFIKEANGFNQIEEALNAAKAAATTAPKGPSGKELARLVAGEQQNAGRQYSALTHGNASELEAAADRAKGAFPASPRIQLRANTPETSKALVPQLGTPAANFMPQDAHVGVAEKLQQEAMAKIQREAAARQYAALTSGNSAEQGMADASHQAELAARMQANPERGLTVIPKPTTEHSITDMLKNHLNNAKNKITGLPGAMKDKAVAGADAGMDAIKGNPGKAALGGLALSGGAHFGGQAAGQMAAAPGNAAHQISLKNPTVNAVLRAEAKQRSSPTDGILDKLMGSIKQHPYYWGGGAAAAAGAGGLHYYLNKQKHEKDQPGGEPELT